MLLPIDEIRRRRLLPATGDTAAALYSDEGSPTGTTLNIQPRILSILCWNVQVFDSLKAERNPVVNAVILDVLSALEVDLCFLLETREHPDVNMNSIEPTAGEDLVYQQVGSELTGSLRCPPHRLYPPGSGGSFLDIEYTEERQRSWRLPRRLYPTEAPSTSAASAPSETDETGETPEAAEADEEQDGPADWLALYRDELFRYYDLYAVRTGEPQEVSWPDALPADLCLLDKDGRIFHTKASGDARAHLIHCADVSEKDKPKTPGRVKYMKLARGGFQLQDLQGYRIQSLDPPVRKRLAHDGLDDLVVSDPFGLALLAAGALKPLESVQDRMFVFEHKGTSDPDEDFGKLCAESEGRWFKHSWKEEFRDGWRDRFDLYLADRATFSTGARDGWQWVSVIPAGPPNEDVTIFQLRKCGACKKYLGDPWSACPECRELRSGTERENLRQTLQSTLGGAGWSGFETYSALVRCNSSTRAGSVIPLAGRKASVLRSFNRLLDLDPGGQPLGYIKPKSTFYGRCPFLLPVRLQPVSGPPVDLPVIAFHAPYGQATKAGIKARADSMREIFKAQISYLPGKPLLDDYENVLVLGDFNLDVKEDEAGKCYKDYESRGLLPKIVPGTKTTLQKLDKRQWPALREKAPETVNHLSSSYDNIFLKSSALAGACKACVVDVIAHIQENKNRYMGLVESYFAQHPKSGKKADWESFKEDGDLGKHVGAYIYASFVSDHLPVLADLEVQAGSLAGPSVPEEAPVPLLIEKITQMLGDLDFDVADLNEAVRQFEDWSGVPRTGKVDWITYWRILARWDPERYEKEAARTERPSRRRRRWAMGPGDIQKLQGLAALQEGSTSAAAADVSGT